MTTHRAHVRFLSGRVAIACALGIVAAGCDRHGGDARVTVEVPHALPPAVDDALRAAVSLTLAAAAEHRVAVPDAGARSIEATPTEVLPRSTVSPGGRPRREYFID